MNAKKEALRRGLSSFLKELPEIVWIRPMEQGLRDRLDFVYESGRYGMYSHELDQILDLKTCSILSPLLSDLYEEFRKISLPIQKGSFRLRVSPEGDRGIWLDFANLDIKKLLEEKKELLLLLKLGFVEIGQKSKRLVLNQRNELKLADPIFHSWFRTYESRGQAFDLSCMVGSFTQPGHQLNKVLIEQIHSMFQGASFHSAAEFGAGIGNLTLPFLDYAKKIHVYDWDATAFEGLKETLRRYPFLVSKIEFHLGDFRHRGLSSIDEYDFFILNPARSGLGKFLMGAEQLPAKEIFYMSCYLESFVQDAQVVAQKGYELLDLRIFDQFPHTPHFEILSRWKKIR